MANTTDLISQLEPSAPKEIIVNPKMWTGVYIFFVGTGASVIP